ncbi:MAG TPA: hypothetical protein DCG39_06570, partial [Opitutae bacterium]|nr:hypothetical protein [Opitutae bacterium]
MLVRRLLFFAVFVLPLGCWAQSMWIWEKDGRSAGTKLSFAKAFDVSGHPIEARLKAVGDFCSLEVRLNGRKVGQSPAHGSLIDERVEGWLTKGKNIVTISARSAGKAPAVA